METLLPLVIFAFVSSITPGPNNIMLTSSGLLFGFLRSIPHILGITFGFGVLLAMCAVGVGSLVLALPVLHVVLKLVGSAYLLYLAWGLRNMVFVQDERHDVKPMSFVGAAVFQFINPKAWIMAVTGASAFLPVGRPAWLAVAMLCFVFCAVNLPCVGVWAGAGAALRRHLSEPKWQRLFCTTMVILTAYSAVAIWF